MLTSSDSDLPYLWKYYVFVKVVLQELFELTPSSAHRIAVTTSPILQLYLSRQHRLKFYLTVYEAARWIWAPTFQLNSSRCNRHLPMRSTIALKTGTWFSNYYCRAFEHLSTMLTSIFAVGTEYWCAMFELCAVYIWNFSTPWKYVWTSFGWSIAARATFGVIFLLAAMLTGVAVDTFQCSTPLTFPQLRLGLGVCLYFHLLEHWLRAKCCALGLCQQKPRLSTVFSGNTFGISLRERATWAVKSSFRLSSPLADTACPRSANVNLFRLWPAYLWKYYVFVKVVLQELFELTPSSAHRIAVTTSPILQLSLSRQHRLKFYLSVYGAARWIWAPTFQLNSSRCNRHLPMRSTIALKTGTWFSNYYCRAFEHLSTMLASILQWVRSIDVLCLSLCRVFLKFFYKMKIHLDIFWLKYCCKSNLWRDISLAAMLTGVAVDTFQGSPRDLSAAETRTWCFLYLHLLEHWVRAKCCALGLC